MATLIVMPVTLVPENGHHQNNKNADRRTFQACQLISPADVVLFFVHKGMRSQMFWGWFWR